MKIKVSNYSNLTANTLLLPIENNKHLKKRLVAIAEQFGLNQSFTEDFTGKHKEILPLYTNQNQPAKLFLIGLGNKPSFIKAREAMRSFSFHNKNRLGDSVAIDLSSINTNLSEAIINGLELSTYNIHLYQTSKHKNHPLKNNTIEAIIDENNHDVSITAIKKGILTGESQKEAFDLVNQDAGHLTPEALGKWAKASGKKYGYDVKVYGKEAIEEMGLKAYLAVNRGSEFAPAFIVAEYKSKAVSNPKKIGLVGKGVTFDTGGLNMKSGAGMRIMKKDMGGAATVLGLAHMIMGLGINIRLRVLIPAVENSIDGDAFRPQDILTSRKGLTVEINNTDAEGRLVLADALTYSDEDTPALVISMATLTGAARVAVGPDIAPFYTENDAHAVALADAAQGVCDPVWRMPFHTPYEAMIEPGVADLDNAPKGGMAGSITAALFLRRFVESPYIHFDIYGWQPAAAPARPKGGVGMGARAILEALPKLLNL